MARKQVAPASAVETGGYNFRHKGAKKLRSLEIQHAKNGGHIVTHHFHYNPGGMSHEHEEHVFGQDQGPEMLAHVAKHTGVKARVDAEQEAESPAKEAAESLAEEAAEGE